MAYRYKDFIVFIFLRQDESIRPIGTLFGE